MHNSTVEILIPQALPRLLTYALPEGLVLREGDYVTVPLGKKETIGVAWNAQARSTNVKLKYVIAHHAHLPPLSPSMRDYVDWVAHYTMSTPGAVLKMVMPVAKAIPENGKQETGKKETSVSRDPLPVSLNAAQSRAAETLRSKLGQGFSVTLLDGLTGSGKTEVYFDMIAQALSAEGSQVLVLLPEIALSIQWLKRFEQRFGFKPHVWHSGVTPAKRKKTWGSIAQGEARVIVGARSALFLPYKNLRAIVVDEEHDNSYKQEDGVMYHARDMAVMRGHFEKIPVVLVSATPSLETCYNVTQGKYSELKLERRHNEAAIPEAELIDMRHSPVQRGAFVSDALRAALQKTLDAGQQAMLFLNRRGYAPLVLCRTCGHHFECPQCTSWLVLHRTKPRLQCHHCGHIEPAPEQCPVCSNKDTIAICGPGVERVAEEMRDFLPGARMSVLASDQTGGVKELEAHIHAIESGETNLIIGTQMIAKGHHFGNLTLVGVIDADLGLKGGDLRAAERTYQLLHQLSGRAGREAIPGKVLIQSFQPEHPVMQALIHDDRDAFMQLELDARRESHMPPFSRLAAIIIEGTHEAQVAEFARALAVHAPHFDNLTVLGPAPAPLYRLRNHYRQRLLVKADKDVNIQHYLRQWLDGAPAPSALKVKVDIEPYSFV